MNRQSRLKSRRSILKWTALASLQMIVPPGLRLVGQTPEGEREYVVDIRAYPELNKPGGSVLLRKPAELELNPDHREWNDAALRRESGDDTCQRGWYPIALTRVAVKGTSAFAAVSTLCPHEAEYQVRFDPEKRSFICCHKWSTFRSDGTWVPPGSDGADDRAPNDWRVKRGLRRFRTAFDGKVTVRIFVPTKT